MPMARRTSLRLMSCPAIGGVPLLWRESSEGSPRDARQLSRESVMIRPMLNRIRMAAALLGLAALQDTACAETILFVGNSFTFGAETPLVQGYRPDTVTDLNHEGIGGVPALF